ncbi:uncharacterized protein N7518_000112 [Penicillium psychrosexuale]|uniref:uncharacterized protein n=1 Tax=Penicillium psychrosexuale TaxID=1002107 RepID=UPI002544F4E8|nr:uncharacterized protein N7518_000112 [Penicillium psychrosexuale]KAJ5803809.1 hypothetical protein N7518_000112 [Penicillium psychrosexuale]
MRYIEVGVAKEITDRMAHGYGTCYIQRQLRATMTRCGLQIPTLKSSTPYLTQGILEGFWLWLLEQSAGSQLGGPL